MIVFTPRAGRQVRALQDHYEERGRPEASRRLAVALERAWASIAGNPGAGLPAPRPYPELARPGERWIESGRYWIVYQETPPVILGVFFETSDIPGRL